MARSSSVGWTVGSAFTAGSPAARACRRGRDARSARPGRSPSHAASSGRPESSNAHHRNRLMSLEDAVDGGANLGQLGLRCLELSGQRDSRKRKRHPRSPKGSWVPVVDQRMIFLRGFKVPAGRFCSCLHITTVERACARADLPTSPRPLNTESDLRGSRGDSQVDRTNFAVGQQLPRLSLF